MTMKRILTDIIHFLDQGSQVILATIIDHGGSTPRTAGARMIVRSDGGICGTVGGGLLEAQVIAQALDLFKTGATRLLSFDLGGDHAADMICGGRVTVLLELLRPDSAELDLWRAARQIMNSGGRAVMVSELPDTSVALQRHLVSNQFLVAGSRLPAILEKAMAHAGSSDRAVRIVAMEARRFLIELIYGGGTVFLFGAGHVSQQVASLVQQVDFGCVVIDDRPEFANRQRFPAADEIIVLSSFHNATADVTIDQNSYLVIVTRGHRHDETVLAQALKTRAGYIGMIGSRRKRDTIYDNLRRQGVGQSDLDRVHCPIGFPICAETPAEIAVSIVAELIAVRAKIDV